MSKASKQRDCPAVGHAIPTSECVAERHRRYACPAHCPHDPFTPANYLRFLELEGNVDRKSMDFLMEHAPDLAAMQKALQQARSHPSIHAMHAWYEWNLFFALDAGGQTPCERWEKAGFSGLKSDGQLLIRAKMQTRIALLEIHRVFDNDQVEAVDLLSPGTPPMVFQDRNLTAMAVRFASALTWIYPLPHFWRLSGTAVLIPDMAELAPEEIVSEIVRHLGGPTEAEPMRRWLAEHLVRFDDALQATCRLRRMKMFAGMDARYGKAVYELRTPFAECRKLLDEVPEVEPEDLSDAERQEGFAESRVWFTESVSVKAAVPAGARAVLGRVLLGQSHWRVEGMGGERFAQLRRQFEARLGPQVRFAGERLDDLGAAMSAREPAVNEALCPPRLLENPQQIVLASSRIPAPPPGLSNAEAELELLRAADRVFLDDAIPALNNRTPREAARDPALRPRLIRLLKERVRSHDERNLRAGRTDDINWLLRELGADEIIFDPPPWRPPPPAHTAAEDLPGDDAETISAPDPGLPPAPPLPALPFTAKEAGKRLDAAMAAFATAAEAEEALYAGGLTLIDDASELTEKLLSDDEFSFVVAFLLQVALAFVPPGHRAPALNFKALAEKFHDALDEMNAAVKSGSPDRLQKFPMNCAQPELMLLLTIEILEGANTGPKKLRPSHQAQSVNLALVRASVDELDEAMRRRSLHFR